MHKCFAAADRTKLNSDNLRNPHQWFLFSIRVYLCSSVVEQK
jgi:hypothetical protein